MRGFSTKLDRRNCLTLPACVVHLHILVRSLAGVAKDGAVHWDVAPGLVAASGKEQVIALVRSWRKCGDINWIIFHLSPYKEQKQYPVRNEKSMRSRDNVSRLLNPKDSKIIFSFGPKVWESAGSVLNKLFCLAFSLFFYKGAENNFPPLFLTKSPPFLFLPLFPLIFQVFFREKPRPRAISPGNPFFGGRRASNCWISWGGMRRALSFLSPMGKVKRDLFWNEPALFPFIVFWESTWLRKKMKICSLKLFPL